jgi:hypothetical protein
VDDPFWDYDPPTDSDGSGQCFLTENDFGNTDVDSGSVELISPNLDMSGSGPFQISYDYYLYLTVGGGDDRLLVEISSNGTGGPWTTVATHDTSGGLAWRSHAISQQVLTLSGVSLTANMRVRFTANDGGDQSIVEAGVDAFSVDRVECESCSDGILNQGEDLIDCGGPCGPCECLNGAACDDGAFCNGAESCDGFGQCQPGSDPCTGSACRESDDSCVAYGDGDFDADLDRDLQDYAAMQNCFGQDAAGACEPGNLNGGIEIDLDDYAEFQPLVGPPN